MKQTHHLPRAQKVKSAEICGDFVFLDNKNKLIAIAMEIRARIRGLPAYDNSSRGALIWKSISRPS